MRQRGAFVPEIMNPAQPLAPESARYLAGYLSYIAHERRLSPLTSQNYRRDIGLLLQRTAATGLIHLGPSQIRRFVAELHGKGMSGRSLARILSSWRGFYRYLNRDHGFDRNPCAGIRAPKVPRKLPHALSPDEARQLLDVAPSTPVELRDRAMFELFYSSGLRLAELIGVEVAQLRFVEGTVEVTGKGRKTRIVPVGTAALTAIREWMPEREKWVRSDTRALFVNRNGTPLSARSVQVRLRHWGVKHGLSSHVHPHALRHSFASHVLQSSGDLRAVQEMLGHASISTTQVYTHLDFQHLAKVYDAAHPRAKRKGNGNGTS